MKGYDDNNYLETLMEYIIEILLKELQNRNGKR